MAAHNGTRNSNGGRRSREGKGSRSPVVGAQVLHALASPSPHRDTRLSGGPEREAPEVQYLVLPDPTSPYLLARVRWPDIAQAISAGRPEWQDDMGLFDLPNEPTSAIVTPARAASIAAGWGANLTSDATASASGPALIRRMPANWSNLAPAEKRAWSLEGVVASPLAGQGRSRRRVPAPSGPWPGRWRSLLRRRRPPQQSHLEAPERIWESSSTAAVIFEREERGDPLFESLPAIVLSGADVHAAEDDSKLPAVFSRMGGGSSKGPVAVTDKAPRTNGRGPVPHDGSPLRDEDPVAESTICDDLADVGREGTSIPQSGFEGAGDVLWGDENGVDMDRDVASGNLIARRSSESRITS